MSPESNDRICILLAVWGERFIDDFLQLSLPSLLASGNIPALVEAYPTRMVFLTRMSDLHVFEKNAAFQKLKSICEVEFVSIEDILVFGNYSTTLTFAYDRAIKQTGEEMLNTYFIFLTSDYIMANGSMVGLLKYIRKGYSGICAGNFQVLQEDIEPFLHNQLDSTKQVLDISPRDLLTHSFQYLHPVTTASFIDQKVIRNYKANRFFLRQDHSVTAGRFYLLHMLCIKPETTRYNVGSSCDYSFIPEMCPSGNIAIINDSDDYLVVEIQSKEHELASVGWGEYEYNHLVDALAEWTTKQHRENANHTIYFHTRDLNERDKQEIEERFNKFVHQTLSKLKKHKEQPFYNHPYWISAVKSFNRQRSLLKNSQDYHYIDLTTIAAGSLPKRLFYKLFGAPPNVFIWHHRWLEYRFMKERLKEIISATNKDDVAVFYGTYLLDFMRYCGWLKTNLGVDHHYHIRNLTATHSKLQELQERKFSTCILFTRMDDLIKAKDHLNLIKDMVKPTGKTYVFIINERNHLSSVVYDFKGEFAHKINLVTCSPFHMRQVETINNNLTMLGTMTIDRVSRMFSYSKKIRFASYASIGLLGSIFCSLRNALYRFRKHSKGHCTGIIVTLVPESEATENAG